MFTSICITDASNVVVCVWMTKMPNSSPNPMLDHLLESSHRDDSNKWSNIGFGDHLLESFHRDDSNKWSNIGFGEEITHVGSIEVNFAHVIWIYDYLPAAGPAMREPSPNTR